MSVSKLKVCCILQLVSQIRLFEPCVFSSIYFKPTVWFGSVFVMKMQPIVVKAYR